MLVFREVRKQGKKGTRHKEEKWKMIKDGKGVYFCFQLFITEILKIEKLKEEYKEYTYSNRYDQQMLTFCNVCFFLAFLSESC